MLEARHVAFSYAASRPLLRDVTLTLEPGTFTAILGPNGCGKSTLMSLFTAARAPQAGEVLLDGTPVGEVPRALRAQLMAFVSQHSHGNRLTVFDAVLMGRRPRMEGAPNAEDLAAVEAALASLKMDSLALRHLDELSCGEYQTVMLARAFVQDTPYLLLDEPTNNLDLAHQHRVLDLVRTRVDERGVGAAAVLHDVNLALRHCDRFAFLRDGVVDACGGVSIVTADEIRRVFHIGVDIIEHGGVKVMIPTGEDEPEEAGLDGEGKRDGA